MYFAYTERLISGSYSRSFIYRASLSTSTLDWEMYNCATVTTGQYDSNDAWTTPATTSYSFTFGGPSPDHSVSGSVSAITNAL